MPVHSAGILLYRFNNGIPEVLLVHPGGPYHAHKDAGAWSIPKGLLDDAEEGLSAAKREFKEEIGRPVPATHFIPLQQVKQRGNKIVYAWAGEGDLDADSIVSNTFRMEYPYKSGKWIEVPEVDRAAWFTLEAAAVRINPGQQPLLDELASILTGSQ